MRYRLSHLSVAAAAVILGLLVSRSSAETTNLRIVTDASPDYTDLPSLVHSATDNFKTPADKCWAMCYWNHIAR